MFTFTEALAEHIEALEEPRPPDGMWHPSSISGCERKSIYEVTGTEPSDPTDATSKRNFRLGHMIHAISQEAVDGYTNARGQVAHAEVTLAANPLGIAGSCDQLVWDGHSWELWEYKSSKAASLRWGDFPRAEHVFQVSCYMLCLREWGGYAGTDFIPPLGDALSHARIVYISKDDLAVTEYPLVWDDERAEAVRGRLAHLDEARKSGVLPDRLPEEKDKKTGKPKRNWQCGYCSYRTTCWGQRDPVQ
jgi:CRISPR/Cas system-associated exonuclease Cas4 (RecB family)